MSHVTFILWLVFQGVEALMEDLIKVTLQQPYVGEHIPEAWLNFEHKITG